MTFLIQNLLEKIHFMSRSELYTVFFTKRNITYLSQEMFANTDCTGRYYEHSFLLLALNPLDTPPG